MVIQKNSKLVEQDDRVVQSSCSLFSSPYQSQKGPPRRATWFSGLPTMPTLILFVMNVLFHKRTYADRHLILFNAFS